jgi:hypothetical protein
MQSEGEWRDFDRDYRDRWTTTGDVMHKEGSTNIITPDPAEMPAASGGGPINADVTPQRIAGTFPSAAPDPGKTRMRPAGIAASAEDTKAPGSARTASDSREWTERDEALSSEQRSLSRERNEMNQHTHEAVLPTAGAGITSESDTSTNWSSARDDMRRGVDEGVIPNSRSGSDIDASRSNLRSERCGSRWRAFEDHLRKNRVDITSSCRSCGPEKERAA